jgi:PAS domain S-box-containing protein
MDSDADNERWGELFEGAHDGVFLLDLADDGRFVVRRFNAAEERLTGLCADQVVGRSIDEFLPCDVAAGLVAKYRTCIETGHPTSYNEEIALPSGDRSFATTLVPLRNGRDRILGIARDITAEVEAERALRVSEEKSRQLAERGVRIREEFIVVADHELRTPLAAMLLQIQVLCRTVKSASPADLESRVDRIARIGARLEHLVEQVLDVHRMTVGDLRLERARCDPPELAKGVTDRFAEASTEAHSEVTVRADGPVEGEVGIGTPSRRSSATSFRTPSSSGIDPRDF